MNIIVNIHSFVDLITNSSTETFVSATSRTKEVIGNIVTELTGRPWQELFDIGFIETKEPEELHEELSEEYPELDEDGVKAKLDEQMLYEGWEKVTEWEWRRLSDTQPDHSNECYEDYPQTTEIWVKAKDPNNEAAVKAGKLLQSLMGTYSLEARADY